ncbi:putative ABC transport system permease protein [Geosporobacter subterraneus DSM 17957]|uniref:Putative ABC transport system permease protein n=1 Tax=Geosporobacter subterraneus DSM 17957 TaxID=1121919 RepID=A0A1M6EWA7_9FIRM|nr:ABC transporter permease [Geosporobacter subterraneus]SHI89722.1 putative ABC transport system permease protein [Geosporobacter subterraneus DSM 17957]
MNLIEIFRAVFMNIQGNKTKVFLTTLGIIVGALTIVLVISIGNGSQASVEEQFRNLNVGTLQIMPAFGGRATERLTSEVAAQIRAEAPSIKNISMILAARADISYSNTSASASLGGVTEDLMFINNLEMAYGTFITEEQNEDAQRVAVIGSDIAQELFGDEIGDVIGERVTILGRRYEITGILKGMGDSSMGGISPDSAVFVPYKVAEKYIVGRLARPTIIALAKDIDHVESAIEEINLVLQEVYRNKSDQFRIIDAGNRLQSAKNSARTMTLMLLAVAVVVLIVGGIGIMNVLFVSVKERTKEIGILKAIGAQKRDILLMFLLEAIMISAVGGVLGILGSMLAMPIMNYFQVRAIPTNFAYLLAFGFSVGIGTFFGYYPASRAAALKPIDALNYE